MTRPDARTASDVAALAAERGHNLAALGLSVRLAFITDEGAERDASSFDTANVVQINDDGGSGEQFALQGATAEERWRSIPGILDEWEEEGLRLRRPGRVRFRRSSHRSRWGV